MAEYIAKRNPDRCPVHPGAIIREDMLPATGKTKVEIARLLGISRQHLHDIIEEKRPISPEVAVRDSYARLKATSINFDMRRPGRDEHRFR